MPNSADPAFEQYKLFFNMRIVGEKSCLILMKTHLVVLREFESKNTSVVKVIKFSN